MILNDKEYNYIFLYSEKWSISNEHNMVQLTKLLRLCQQFWSDI